MEKPVEVLQQHFAQNPPDFGEAESVLDMLFWHYTEYNQIDNEKIKAQFAKLRKLVNLPPKEYDLIFMWYLTCAWNMDTWYSLKRDA